MSEEYIPLNFNDEESVELIVDNPEKQLTKSQKNNIHKRMNKFKKRIQRDISADDAPEMEDKYKAGYKESGNICAFTSSRHKCKKSSGEFKFCPDHAEYLHAKSVLKKMNICSYSKCHTIESMKCRNAPTRGRAICNNCLDAVSKNKAPKLSSKLRFEPRVEPIVEQVIPEFKKRRVMDLSEILNEPTTSEEKEPEKEDDYDQYGKRRLLGLPGFWVESGSSE